MTNQSNEHLSIGYRIGGHYEIVKVLGQGGFGIVYLVKDIHRLDAYFVIKELFSREFSFRHRDGKTVYNRAEAKQIFQKIKDDIISEVNILQKIRNRNIVEAYGYFEENNTLYSVMEFIDGIDLDKYLKKVPPFSEDEAKDLLLQIIHGIKEIHSLNILHRDMKPSNIMRTEDGIYKIIDFTTNRAYVDNQMTTVTAFQSPIYTPPELSGNKRAIIGKFSDIYSIGMTICRVMAEDEEMLPNITDRLIDDSEFQDIINRLNISQLFKDVLIKMTQIDANDRFQSLDDIEKLISVPSSNYDIDIEDEVLIPTKKSRVSKEPKKRPKDDSSNSSTTILIILLIAILSGLGWYSYRLIEDDKSRAKVSKKSSEVSTYTPTPHHPELKTRNRDEEESQDDEIKSDIKPLPTPLIDELETPTPTPSPSSTEVSTPTPEPTSKSDDIEIVATPKPIITPHPTPKHNISLGTMIQAGKNFTPSKEVFTRASVQNFLLQFMSSSEGDSVNRVLQYYNYRVGRYFSLRDITHREIYRDKVRYNRKWVKREYGLLSFKILSRYKLGDIDYCDIEKRISYRVVSSRSEVRQGISRVRMTLKNSPHGFKVTSIYTVK